MRVLPALALALVSLAAAGAVARVRRPESVRKTTIAVLPEEIHERDIAVSDDGTAYALVVRDGDGARVVGSAGSGALHAECSRAAYAPHTSRLFYWAVDRPEGRSLFSVVSADGSETPTAFTSYGVLAFSGNGMRWAAAGVIPGTVAGEPGPIVIVADGAERARGDDLSLPAFSADGGHLAYLARTGPERVALVVDGSERRVFDVPRPPCAQEALAAARRPDLPGRHVVRYLADGSLLVATRDADGWGVYRDDAKVASYTLATLDPRSDACTTVSAFAPATIRSAEAAPVSVWWERLEGAMERWHVVRDGRPIDDVICDAPWKQQPPELSHDGRHCAYACRSSDRGRQQVQIVRDGTRYGPYAEVWGIALSDGEGTHVAYGAVELTSVEPGERPWAMYVDGRVRGGRWHAVWRPRLGRDGVTLAWEARVRDDARAILGLNDRALAFFDDVLWGPVFESYDRDVAWIVRRGRALVRITADVAEARRRARK